MAKESRTFLQDSGWKFVTSEGLNFGVGGSAGVAATLGNLFVAPKNTGDPDPYRKSKDNPYKLRYASIGGSYGKSLLPGSGIDGATTDMFSAGVIYANPLRTSGETLSINDLTGTCLLYSASGVMENGVSVTTMFIGVGHAVVCAILANVASAAGGPAVMAMVAGLTPAAIISSCKAAVFFVGVLIGSPFPSGGATVQLGEIVLLSNLVEDGFKNTIKEAEKIINQG